nr:alanine:cation symporter family protein [Nonomuraea terrae]
MGLICFAFSTLLGWACYGERCMAASSAACP